MKKFLLFAWFWIAFSGKAFAQKQPLDSLGNARRSPTSFYLEFGGNAMVGSFNFERLVRLPNPNVQFAFRLGCVYVPVLKILGGSTTHEFFVPAEVSLLCGTKALKPEFGAGITYNWSSGEHVIYPDRYESEIPSIVFSVLRFGIRWQILQKPYFVRAGFTPLFFGKMATNSGIPFMKNYGLSFGYNFK